MPLISSPVVYPPSSSPAAPLETRKRPLPNEPPRLVKRRPSESEWLRSGQNDQPGNLIKILREGDAGTAEVERSPTESAHAAVKPSVAKLLPRLGTSVFKRKSRSETIVEDNAGSANALSPSVNVHLENTDVHGLPQVDEDPTFRNEPHTDHELFRLRTASGKVYSTRIKAVQSRMTYEQLIAGRSTVETGKAQKSYYGINVHDLLDQAVNRTDTRQNIGHRVDIPQPSTESPIHTKSAKKGRTMLWTEKYRARKFTDLVGDERTHRTVLRWLKGWDPIVFPGSSRPKPKKVTFEEATAERAQRKIMLLTGPPGLGKTTLAHVCARQAGYEVVEINASDERSSTVVKGRIRDIVGTENVRGVNTKCDSGTVRKAGRPVCVVVDEVDGVVGGSEGGFIKALMDLVTLDSKNSSAVGASSGTTTTKKSKKGDRFRLLRPMILICNDVYHPSLRPLRSSSVAEIVHIRRPTLDKVVARLSSVFVMEGVAFDGDGVRTLCEASWGISNRRENRTSSSNTGEGDMRSILIVGEWVAARLRAMDSLSPNKSARLTRSWVEKNLLQNLSHGGGGARGIGRGGAKEAVERVFQEGAGFPRAEASTLASTHKGESLGDSVGVREAGKRRALDRLREIIDMSGETDRIMTDCFAAYPSQPFQDDMYLSKPNAAYEWLHFHDCLSSKVHSGQEWELAGYLSQPTLGFHHLFASPAKHHSANDRKRWDEEVQDPLPFSGPRADYEASETLKQNKAILQGVQSSLSISLFRSFKSAEDISTDLVPHLNRVLMPNVKPIVVGGSGEQKGIVSVRKGSEKAMLERAVGVMGGVGVTFERSRIEGGYSGTNSYVYRMEP